MNTLSSILYKHDNENQMHKAPRSKLIEELLLYIFHNFKLNLKTLTRKLIFIKTSTPIHALKSWLFDRLRIFFCVFISYINFKLLDFLKRFMLLFS